MKKGLLFLMLSVLSMGAWAQAQWMNGLNDNIYISQLSLPGAHDAATKSLSIGKCQDKDIAGLWDAGVRVFDLRPTDSGNDCTINHGILSTGVTLKAALTTINGRLSSNTSEFAIVLMRKESGGDSWASKVANVISQFSNVMPFRQNLRLGDVRGKILVLSRDYFADGYKIDYWNDNTTRDVRSANGIDFVVQDYYEVNDKTTKSTAITNILTEARTNTSTNRMFINHTSGYYPGTISGLSDDITGNAQDCNTLAYNTINANPGPTGIILMDFAGSSSYNGANLVSKIIAQNNNIPTASPSEPVTGEYYVYNVERDMYITRSNNYATRGGFDKAGMVIAVNNSGNGTLTLVTNVNGIGKGIFIADGNGETVYVDNTPTSWTFECVDNTNKIYTLKNGSSYLQAKNGGTILVADALPSNNAAKWQFIPRQIREDLSVASSTNPVDVTYLIENQGFDRYNGEQNSWKNADNSNWRPGDGWCHNADASNNCAEVWNANFNIHQSFTGLPNGVYELRVQGYYRISEGNNSDYLIAQMRAGNNVQRTKYYINATEAYLLPQLSATLPAEYADNSVDINGTTYRYPNGKGKASIAFREGYYENEPIQAIVKDGNLTIGMKLDNKNGEDWNCFDNFRLYYLGLPDISQFTNALEAAIAAAQAYNGNTTTALQNALDAALAEAIAVRNSTDTDELTAKTDALNTARVNAEAADVTFLRATILLAQADGIDVTTANDVLANGTTASQVNNALNTVRTARRLNAVDKQPDIFTGSAPENGGQYYIYNVGTQRYLTGGVNYGTHAAVNFAAQIATFTKDGDGWRIHTNIRTGRDALNHNGFVDCEGDGETWYLIEVSTGVYNISQTNSNTGATLLGYSGERRGNWWQVDTDNEGADQAINQWKLISKAERDALMANASETNPVDATYYIHAAGFDHHLPSAQLAFPLTQWQTWFPEGKGGNNGIGGWEPDFNWESWNSGNIKFYQELTGLTPGKYRLTAQAYYRHGNFEQAVSEFNNPKTDGAILYATNGNGVTAQTYIVPITSEVDKVPGYGRSSSVGSFPDDRNETAAQFFEAGLYKNVVNDIVVTADGTLTIGVEKFENNQGSEWVVADNFRLTYLGLASVEVGSANYTTFVAPYNISELPSGVEAYACQVGTSSVHLEPVEAIPAGEAVVLKNAGTYTFRPTTSEVELGTTNDLLPSDGTITGAAGNIYALANKSNGVGFYPVGSDVTVPAGKGYLVIPNTVKAFYGFEEDNATSINEELRMKSEESSIYNVAGQRLNKVQKGINIVNGKKILK